MARTLSLVAPLFLALSIAACTSDGSIGDGQDPYASPEDMTPISTLGSEEGRAAEEPDDDAPPEADREAEGWVSGLWVYDHVQIFSNNACRYVGACSNGTYNGHHPSASRALDLMVSSYGTTSTAGYAKGDKLAAFALANKRKFGIWYVIWKQRINYGDGRGWQWMENRGSITQNHYDHVHVSFYTSANLGMATQGTGAATTWCSSYTLGRNVPAGTCVQSKVDWLWYQCSTAGTWWYAPKAAYGTGPQGACTARYPR